MGKLFQDQFLNDFEQSTEMLSIKIFEDKGFNTQLTENLDLIINDSSNIDSILEEANKRNDVIFDASSLTPKNTNLNGDIFELGRNLLQNIDYELDEMNASYSSSHISAGVNTWINNNNLYLRETITGDFNSLYSGIIPYESKLSSIELKIYKKVNQSDINLTQYDEHIGELNITGIDITLREYINKNFEIESAY